MLGGVRHAGKHAGNTRETRGTGMLHRWPWEHLSTEINPSFFMLNVTIGSLVKAINQALIESINQAHLISKTSCSLKLPYIILDYSEGRVYDHCLFIVLLKLHWCPLFCAPSMKHFQICFDASTRGRMLWMQLLNTRPIHKGGPRWLPSDRQM